MVRAKLRLTEVTDVYWSQQAKRYKFDAQYDESIPEDQRFAKATPSGEFTMQVDNPAAQAQLKLGETYYVDFTPATPAGA